MAMSNEHKDRLKRNHVQLVDELEISEALLAVLRQDNILTSETQEAIESQPTRGEKVRNLLNILPRRGKRAFEVFIKALCETSQEELAELLDQEMCTKYRSVSSEQDETDKIIPALDINGRIASEIERQDFAVKVNTMSPGFKQKLISDSNLAYSLRGEPYGRALIIGNYKDEKDGLGIESDMKYLSDLFDQLHFETDMKLNLTFSELHSVLDIESKCQKPTYSAFILFILNHGSRRKEIFCKDGKPMKIDEILSYFDGGNCPNLREKPKLFFIHTGEPPQVRLDETDGCSPSATEKPFSVAGDVSDGVTLSAQPTLLTVHDKADVLLVLSTSDVWRCKSKGSWFIRCLCLVISSDAASQDLDEMMRKVISFTNEKGKLSNSSEKQSTLRKKFYFMP